MKFLLIMTDSCLGFYFFFPPYVITQLCPCNLKKILACDLFDLAGFFSAAFFLYKFIENRILKKITVNIPKATFCNRFLILGILQALSVCLGPRPCVAVGFESTVKTW